LESAAGERSSSASQQMWLLVSHGFFAGLTLSVWVQLETWKVFRRWDCAAATARQAPGQQPTLPVRARCPP